MAFYQADWHPAAIYLISCFMGCGIVGGVVMPWSIFPDVTDLGELEFGYRIAGSFSGVMTFTRKFSGAIGIFIVGMTLELSGYLPPVIGMIDGKYSETLQTQPETVITALQLIVFLFPACLLVPAFFVARTFSLDHTTHEKLRQHLEFKRGERPEDNLTAEELADMRRQLV
jgi:Na+/melibiose symporter-like transporter